MGTRVKTLIAACAAAVVAIAAVSAMGDGDRPAGGTADPLTPICPEPERGVVTEGDREGRQVALTFDDGPGAATGVILRALERHGAKGTFFVLGREIPGREDMLREAIAGGHEVANHSSSHSPLPSKADIAAAGALITEATGAHPCLFRPPEGRYDDRLLRTARSLGMTTVTWDVDTADWASQAPAAIRDRALAGVQPGSIVLMHDGGGERSGTARSLSAVIAELHARDYELVTVSELMRGGAEESPPRAAG